MLRYINRLWFINYFIEDYVLQRFSMIQLQRSSNDNLAIRIKVVLKVFQVNKIHKNI